MEVQPTLSNKYLVVELAVKPPPLLVHFRGKEWTSVTGSESASSTSRRIRNRVFQPLTNKQSLLIEDGMLFARQDLSSQFIRAMWEKEKKKIPTTTALAKNHIFTG